MLVQRAKIVKMGLSSQEPKSLTTLKPELLLNFVAVEKLQLKSVVGILAHKLILLGWQ
jgi:hypothetical protein